MKRQAVPKLRDGLSFYYGVLRVRLYNPRI